MSPICLVLDRPQDPERQSSSVVGMSYSILSAPKLELDGSPLPLLVQCMAADIPELHYITSTIDEIAVDSSLTHEELVKEIATAIERERIHIFPHIHQFYGIIRSDFVNKCIAVDFIGLEFLKTEDSTLLYHTFPTFTRAFIYVLAGGNDNLRKWGLNRYVGTDTAWPIATSTPRLGMSPNTASSFLTNVTSRAKHLLKKGKERGQDDEVSALIMPEPVSTAESSIPAANKAQPAREEEIPAAWKKEFTPVHIIPPDYLAEYVEKAAIFLNSETERRPIYTREDDLTRKLNGPYSFSRHDDLPPYATYYLRTHGWDDRMVEAVTVAYMCQATLKGFLAAMSRKGMPLCEAAFLWHTLQHMCKPQA